MDAQITTRSKQKETNARVRALRDEALAKGEEFYFTGRPCKRGHVSNRRARDAGCVECANTYRRDMQREYFITSKYKMSKVDLEALLVKQNYVCALCYKFETRKGPTGLIRPLSVDHCHDTGRVRGLLCSNCNNAIGQLQHDPALIRRAAIYCEWA